VDAKHPELLAKRDDYRDKRNIATDGCIRIRDWLASRDQSATINPSSIN
jgi:hypothetical protein